MQLKNQSVSQKDFAMIPRADIPRSSFRMQKSLKTTFNGGSLVPIFCEEILPGDTWNMNMDLVMRMPALISPIMDSWWAETQFWFVPNRIVWNNWVKFQGEQEAPGDSTAYTIPQIVSPAGGYNSGTLYDYFGLPTVGQVTPGQTVSHSALPIRAYAEIWNEWYRDQNLQVPFSTIKGDGPDPSTTYLLENRGKRHDYFTSCLPFVQKGPTVNIPLGTTAPIRSTGTGIAFDNPSFGRTGTALLLTTGVNTPTWSNTTASPSGAANFGAAGLLVPSLTVDLSTAAGAAVNTMRQAVQVQRLLERDARSGTRYTEALQARFGVRSPDARLQRPEYLGGGSVRITTTAIPQTSATNITGGTTPTANLAATAHGQKSTGWTQSFVEHGYIIGVISVRSDINYQQGLRRHWSRLTRYDFYEPVFQALGEQAVLNKEIYVTGTATDTAVFGYQERWAEYRYTPGEITGLFRSTATGTLDYWHQAQRFAALPTLNNAFISDAPPVRRALAGGATTNNAEFFADIMFSIKAARPMPLYSVPGQMDHF